MSLLISSEKLIRKINFNTAYLTCYTYSTTSLPQMNFQIAFTGISWEKVFHFSYTLSTEVFWTKTVAKTHSTKTTASSLVVLFPYHVTGMCWLNDAPQAPSKWRKQRMSTTSTISSSTYKPDMLFTRLD